MTSFFLVADFGATPFFNARTSLPMAACDSFTLPSRANMQFALSKVSFAVCFFLMKMRSILSGR